MKLHITEVEPPAEDKGAITLTGFTLNPEPERWLKIENVGAVPSGEAFYDGAELVVRNVSRPTLKPFRPSLAKATGAAMIVVPGGGFTSLMMDREGYSAARWLNERGIAAFVLKYRLAQTKSDSQAILGDEPTSQMLWRVTDGGVFRAISDDRFEAAARAAEEDSLEAIRYVRAHIGECKLSTHKVGIMGFSAGAIAAICAALNADCSSRPDLVAPIYGALTDGASIPSTAPPAFIVTAHDDLAVPPKASLTIYDSLQAAGVSAELHVFENGGHGFGMLQQGRSSDNWLPLFDRWLFAHGFTPCLTGGDPRPAPEPA